MTAPNLSIVIHAEEDFDWGGGFYRSNTKVTHGDELIRCGGKVTLAMDYPFINSLDGKSVVKHFKPQQGKSIEFATHLHPWVNPPYENTNDEVPSHHSFPGNLPKDLEFKKIKILTEEVERETGVRPITYLAGRYGIGENSAEILKSLGYGVDLSISAYTNFSHIAGPNFVDHTNKVHSDGGLTYIPHTCSIVSISRAIESHFNLSPARFDSIQKSKLLGFFSKLLRIKKYRLSPEGFSFEHLKKPSVKVGGGTVYIITLSELYGFKRSILNA